MQIRVLLKSERECTRKAVGPVAQVVEQLTFNQWVEGSNPSGLTNIRFFVFCLLTAENRVFLVYCGLQRFGRVDWSRQNQQK